MTKKHFLILVIAVTIIGSFVLSANIANATTVTRECNNGPSRNDSGGCGTACVPLCNDMSFVINNNLRGQCINEANKTAPWTKYRATRRRTTTSGWWAFEGDGWMFDFAIWGIPTVGPITEEHVRLSTVCSIADKCDGNTCGDSPFLRAGRCECGVVGGRYKICCRREGNRYVEVAAIRAGQQDRFLPEEGMCPGGWIAPPNVTRCPAPIPTPAAPIPTPEFRIDSFSANPTRITPGQSTTLTWATTGATDCRITRTGGAGLGNVPPDGSGQSNPPATTTYTLNCGRIGALTDRRMAHVTITVASVTEAPAAQEWWFCMNNACQQTTAQYTTAADCQAAVLFWHRINVACRRTRSECEQGCDVQIPPPSPPPPPPPPTCSSFSATRSRILYKQTTRLEWSCSNVDSCSITSGPTNLRPSGSLEVSPRATTTYTLTCHRGNQSVSRTITIQVFTPGIREVPVFYDGFMRVVGRIGDGLQ